ncbi:MAG TPA: DUF4199 domain-containing protein [Bacteroidia bacterium]|nr:DUF4199 domain-containing protein [Bacteroidia bacterium]
MNAKEWLFIKRYGTISALVLVGINLLIWMIGYDSFDYNISETIVYAALLFSLSFIMLAIKSIRDHVWDGNLNFSKGLTIGLICALFPAFAFATYTGVFYSYEGESFIQYMVEGKSKTLSPEDYKLYTDSIKQNMKLYLNPFFQAAIMAFTVMFMGLVISIFSSLLLKRKSATV